ncbi:MAG: VWA domain-containing protein [Clostridiales bacterium]|nr:VWA domain-containing protein [Clostridiales bacterium]
MKNFHIYFAYPWALLALVLAVVLTLIPYFRLSKRYRKTRNRITSIVLHLIVMTLAIVTLAGIEFRYQIPNENNEIILLVDVSDTEETVVDERDAFVRYVIEDAKHDNFRVGIVTFGYDYEYAVPLTNELDGIYDQYLNAASPDTTATNVAGALEYAKTLFNNPETSKIVLITDGRETDREMTNVVRAISAQGTKVDVAHIGEGFDNADVQLMGVEMPSHHIAQNEECTVMLNVQSTVATSVSIRLTDNGETANEVTVDLNNSGMQTVPFAHTFIKKGLHELKFEVTQIAFDGLEQNNAYTTYFSLEVFNKILVLESVQGTSEALITMLNEGNETPYEVTTMSIQDEELPESAAQLCAYDQVVLNNIANKDLPENFAEVLKSYVSEYGGGLFTAGGDKAYDRSDMYGTLYQEMLPVQAINYTPPVAVMIVLDTSGSMSTEDNYGANKLDWAKAGAASCLNSLTERDYVGIMTLESVESTILDLTPRTQESRILAAINSLEEANGGTIWTGAIDRAGKSLRTMKDVAKRHIIVITDGAIGEDPSNYEGIIKEYYENDGTTLSVVGVDMATGGKEYDEMLQATQWGGGQLYVTSADQLINKLRDDLTAPAIKQVNYGTFKPMAYNMASPLLKGVGMGEGGEANRINATLEGFYGVKVRTDAELVLTGDYNVPIYAQWAYGEGMVGSFMCDLQASTWSSGFMADANGRKFLRNAINNLMPSEDIRPSQIAYEMTEDNYTNQLSVFSELKDGEYIKGEIVEYIDGAEGDRISLNEITPGNAQALREADVYVTLPMSSANGYSRCDFVVRKNGTYKIVLTKYNKDGKIVKNASGEDVVTEVYKSFAYSEEYDVYSEDTAEVISKKLATVAERGQGAVIEDLNNPSEVFNGFVTAIDKSFDPRFLFMIIAIVLFLGDIAVRKFKFKWPHEIIRDYKQKKNLKK